MNQIQLSPEAQLVESLRQSETALRKSLETIESQWEAINKIRNDLRRSLARTEENIETIRSGQLVFPMEHP